MKEPWWCKEYHNDIFRVINFDILRSINSVYLKNIDNYYFMIEQAWAQSVGLADAPMVEYERNPIQFSWPNRLIKVKHD